jgi:hypothetical protein
VLDLADRWQHRLTWVATAPGGRYAACTLGDVVPACQGSFITGDRFQRGTSNVKRGGRCPATDSGTTRKPQGSCSRAIISRQMLGRRPTGRVVLAFIAAIALSAVVISGCDEEGGSNGTSLESRSSEGSSGAAPPSDALSQMETAFVGNPNHEEIRADLDKALRLYKVPVTEENYSRAGSSLVALRKETGVAETEILAHTITLHTPGVSLDLSDAFGLAASELALSSAGN